MNIMLFILGIILCILVCLTEIDLGFQIIGCILIMLMTYMIYFMNKLNNLFIELSLKFTKIIDLLSKMNKVNRYNDSELDECIKK